MASQSLSIDVGGNPMPCYLARPETTEPRPAIIVLQEIFGVNTEVKRISDLVASAGYVALAINYYHRTDPDLNEPYTPAGFEKGFAVAAHLTRAGIRADIGAAIDYLDAQDFVKSGAIVTWGFCMGGSLAFLSATLAGLRGAISFYGGSIAAPFPGTEPEALADAGAVRCPLLLVFGGKDDYITADHVARIESTLRANGKAFEVKVYPNEGHAFFRDSSAVLQSNPDVADAWQRVQEFVRAHTA